MKSHEEPRYLFEQIVLGTSVCGLKLTFSLIKGESGLFPLLRASFKQWKIQVEDEN